MGNHYRQVDVAPTDKKAVATGDIRINVDPESIIGRLKRIGVELNQVSISHLKKVFWPNLGVGRSV